MDPSKASDHSKCLDHPFIEVTERLPPEVCPDETMSANDASRVLSVGWQVNQPLGQCMLQLFDAQLWTDVAFRCVDQHEEILDNRVRAHKIVLAARSPVFEAMFFGPWQDSTAEIELRAADSVQFEMFLRLLYSDDVALYDDYDDLVQILEIAHTYQVQVIVDECCRKLAERVSIDNACALLDRALFYDNDHLIGHVSEFIDRNAEQVLGTVGFLDISLPCLTYILKGNTFYANEADIFIRAIEWVRQRCDSTEGQVVRKTLGAAFYFLRTPAMTNVEFVLCTRKKGYYSFDEYEDIVDSIANFETSVLESGCNSKIPRCQYMFTAKRPECTNLSDVGYSESITETLTLDLIANDAVYLTEIHLSKHESAFYLKEGCGTTVDREFMLTDLPLSVTITINGRHVHQSKYTLLVGNSACTPVIQLQQPVLLSAGQSYELEVKVVQDAIKGVMLRVYSCKTSESFIGCEGGSVCVKTKADRNWGTIHNAVVIECLRFKCKSNRD